MQMWNYNLDEMPKNGSPVVLWLEDPIYIDYTQIVRYQQNEWKPYGYVEKAKCWAYAPREKKDDPITELINWFDVEYLNVKYKFNIPYWVGLVAIRDRIEFKMSQEVREDKKMDKSPKLQLTNRGFGFFEFNDYNGNECTLQKSSLMADEDCVWLGREKNQEPHHVTGQEMSPRMHLTQSQARWLGEKLIKFSETGELSDI